MIYDLSVKIKQRVDAFGNSFSEIFYTFREDGEEKYAYTRLRYSVPDLPTYRKAEAEAFLRRRGEKLRT